MKENLFEKCMAVFMIVLGTVMVSWTVVGIILIFR